MSSERPAGPTRMTPHIIERPAQPYVSIRRLVSMTALSEVADEIPKLFGWLAARGVEDAGPPFFKYNVIDMSGVLDVEAGIPVATEMTGDEPVLAGVLPGGRFASLTHLGHPNELREVTGALLDWGAEQGLTWDTSETDSGQRWGLRLELYKTNPLVEPDLNAWETELLFRLADPVRPTPS
jgi:effector-binding domain-containing protein